jgi:hypothetical protein
VRRSPALTPRASPKLDIHRPTLAQPERAKRPPRRRSLFRNRREEEEEEARARTLRIGPFDVSSTTLGVMQMWELGPARRCGCQR